MTQNLVDIISSLIDSIELDINVNSIDGDKIYMCSTLHATLEKTIKSDTALEYTVTEVKNNEWIRVEPKGHAIPFTGSTVTMPAITFLHGDPKSTNSEYLKKENRTSKKTPFVWLVESYNYDDLPRNSAVEISFNVRLFFLDWANINKWKNVEHNKNVVKPMQNLIDEFKKLIEDDYNFKRLDSCRVITRNRFGINAQQPDKKIIDESLSGLEMNFKLQVYDLSQCCES